MILSSDDSGTLMRCFERQGPVVPQAWLDIRFPDSLLGLTNEITTYLCKPEAAEESRRQHTAKTVTVVSLRRMIS